MSNTLQGPLDIALSPAVTVKSIYDRSKAEGYSWPGLVAMELFGGTGFFFPSNASAGAFRTGAGLFELPIGLGLLVSKSFTEWEPPALFDLREQRAMVDRPDAVIPIKLGVDYLGSQ